MNKYCFTRTARFRWLFVASLAAIAAMCTPAVAHATPSGQAHRVTKTWSVSRNGAILQINYGSGRDFPQYAALDLHSGYFRMVYGQTSGFGTSIVLLPALWSKTSCPTDYCQGAPVTESWRRSGADLTLSIRGTIATLKVKSVVTMRPPANNTFVVNVSTTTTGSISLDNRPGEAFKPVMLSSMHISPTKWDTKTAFTGTQTRPFPASGWIIHPPVTTSNFGLQGGTSTWKKNAPTIEVTLARARQVTGWLTASQDPNDDNVGFWCAADKVLSSWTFSVTAEPGKNL